MKTRLLVRTLLLLVCGAALVLACKPPIYPPATGTLRITVANNINARTLVPPISMEAASYTVTGTGPDGATFTETTAGNPITKSGLPLGNWTVVVDAFNSTPEKIGTGTEIARVDTGGITSMAVTVTPLSGSGTLSLTVSWDTIRVQSGSIAAKLTPLSGGADIVLPFGSGSSISAFSVPTGYYALDVILYDKTTVVGGAADVVRIVDGQETTGTVQCALNALGGGLQVSIEPELQNPLLVSITGLPSQHVGTTQGLSANVSNPAGTISYIWYVNGIRQLETGSALTFGSGVAAGIYRVDAIVSNGNQAGSATLGVAVNFEFAGTWSVTLPNTWTITWTITGATLRSIIVPPSGGAILDGNISQVDETLKRFVITYVAVTNIDEFRAYEKPGDLTYVLYALGGDTFTVQLGALNDPKFPETLDSNAVMLTRVQ